MIDRRALCLERRAAGANACGPAAALAERRPTALAVGKPAVVPVCVQPVKPFSKLPLITRFDVAFADVTAEAPVMSASAPITFQIMINSSKNEFLPCADHMSERCGIVKHYLLKKIF